jgi:hypothetical protein
VEPQNLYILFDVFNDIVAYFGENFLFGQIKSMQLNFQSFDMFAKGNNSSKISEKVREDLRLIKVSIAKTLYLNIGNISHSCLLNIIGELFKLRAASKKISISDVKLVDLGGIEYHSTIILQLV